MTKEKVLEEFEDALLKITIKLTKELNDLSKTEERFIEVNGEQVKIENTLLSDNKDDKSFERVMVLINNSDKVKKAIGSEIEDPKKLKNIKVDL